MSLKISTPPSVEPISLQEACSHLRIDADSFADQVTSVQSIAPGAHVIAAAYSLKGTGINVAGKEAIVILESGTNLETGTVDVKIQESDNDSDSAYTDWTGGAFTQVTTSNDNATFEKAYTGTKTYIRAVATVANATCDFGVNVLTNEPTVSDSTTIQGYIKAAREYCENFQNRAFINTTFELSLDAFPCSDVIKIPINPLVSVTSIDYYDTSDVKTTMSASDYLVECDEFESQISLKYSKTWPSTTLRPHRGVVVTFISGYGATAASTPQAVKNAMLLLIGDSYEYREAGKASEKTIETVERILWLKRVI